jgi:catechol 2,3-dioxygenase-like lactoylglutathione lyase family enzyme
MEIPASVTGHTDVAGFGPPGKPEFWIISGAPNKPPLHVAFRVDSRAEVDAFYKAAMAAGGRDNGGPGCDRTIIRTTTAPSFRSRRPQHRSSLPPGRLTTLG